MISQGDSIATVKTEITNAVEHVLGPGTAAGMNSWLSATTLINQAATSVGLDTIANNMAGGTARSRINALFDVPTPDFDVYVNPDTGNDANSGTITSPKATIAAALESNTRVGLARGKVYRERIRLTTQSNVTIGAYGSGANPRVVGSAPHTSGWSNVSGNVWQKDVGFTAINAFIVSGQNVTKLIRGTYDSLTEGQYAASGNNLQIYSAQDPNSLQVEVPVLFPGLIASGFHTVTDGNTVSDIDFWFWGQNGVEIEGGAQNSVIGCDCSYNSNDGMGVHLATATDILFEACTVRRNGQIRGQSGSPGDGISFHDASQGIIRGCVIEDNEKTGIGNESATSVLVESNLLRNNHQEIIILGQGTAAAGDHRIHYNIINWTPENSTVSGTAAIRAATFAQRATVEVFNNTIVAESSASGVSGLRIAGHDVEMRNNIIVGFGRGIDFRGTDEANASLDNDYNCMFGNTVTYFNNGTPGVVAGANDIAFDPLLGNDFTLSESSPCIDAGEDVGLTQDFAGNPVSVPPDIGALEYEG